MPAGGNKARKTGVHQVIVYRDTAEGIKPAQLTGFFAGWPNPPSPASHLQLLRHSDVIVLAVDEEPGHVVGYITAITDHVLAAYIPHLEVLAVYQGAGIGTALVERMVEKLGDLYMIDLVCDPDVVPFYERLGFRKSNSMILRNYQNQSGASEPVLT